MYELRTLSLQAAKATLANSKTFSSSSADPAVKDCTLFVICLIPFLSLITTLNINALPDEDGYQL